MKIAIVGDTHFGSRNDHKVFHDFFGKFYSDILFPYLKEHDITKVIQLGDLFDRRKYINFYTLAESKKYFFDKLDNIEFHTLVGNHDIYWRESLEVNSSSLVLGEYNNVTVHTTPKTIICDNTSIDIIPWICDENKTQVIEFIKNSKSDICMGHFDYNDKKGFHVFDTETRKLDFIENPYSIFHRIQYDDTQKLVDLDKLDLKDCFVRLVVVNKTDYYKFDKYVNTLYNKGCYEIKIVEDLSEFTEGEVGEEINLEDTLSVLSNYIDSVETEADTEKVKTFMKSLYVEAVNLGV
jgi:hypothetical protein